MAAANAFQAARPETAPALEEHRHELTRKPRLLRRRVNASKPADGERIAPIIPLRYRDGGSVQRIRQTFRAGRNGENRGPNRSLWKTDAQLAAE